MAGYNTPHILDSELRSKIYGKLAKRRHPTFKAGVAMEAVRQTKTMKPPSQPYGWGLKEGLINFKYQPGFYVKSLYKY